MIDQLFSFLPRDHIDLFSCGHVIPPQNLLGFSLSSGPSQKHLEFTFSRRGDTDALDELGRILLNLSRIVPGGIVVFFPSYRFEETTVRRWQATKQFDELNARKKVFREPKQSDELANVLAQYSAACASSPSGGGGAMLLSVVGGKMSEGINFSDDLARCVVMVGLPYPNARDAELVEKMTFLDKRTPGAGRQYYESLCMKAVNQSIGMCVCFFPLFLVSWLGFTAVAAGFCADMLCVCTACQQVDPSVIKTTMPALSSWTIGTPVPLCASGSPSGSKRACNRPHPHSGKCTRSLSNSIEPKRNLRSHTNEEKTFHSLARQCPSTATFCHTRTRLHVCESFSL